MKTEDIEKLYMTAQEVSEYLNVTRQRVYALKNAGKIEQMKGAVFNAESVVAYKAKRKNGRPWKVTPETQELFPD
jgi:hypothetical protein